MLTKIHYWLWYIFRFPFIKRQSDLDRMLSLRVEPGLDGEFFCCRAEPEPDPDGDPRDALIFRSTPTSNDGIDEKWDAYAAIVADSDPSLLGFADGIETWSKIGDPAPDDPEWTAWAAAVAEMARGHMRDALDDPE